MQASVNRYKHLYLDTAYASTYRCFKRIPRHTYVSAPPTLHWGTKVLKLDATTTEPSHIPFNHCKALAYSCTTSRARTPAVTGDLQQAFSIASQGHG